MAPDWGPASLIAAWGWGVHCVLGRGWGEHSSPVLITLQSCKWGTLGLVSTTRDKTRSGSSLVDGVEELSGSDYQAVLVCLEFVGQQTVSRSSLHPTFPRAVRA